MTDILGVEYLNGAETKPLHVADWDAQIEALRAENAENKASTGWPKWKWQEHKRTDVETGRDFVTRFVFALVANREDVASGKTPRMTEEAVAVYIPVNENGDVVFLREDEVVTKAYRQGLVDELDEAHNRHKLRLMEAKLAKSKFTAKLDTDIATQGADEDTVASIETMVSSAR